MMHNRQSDATDSDCGEMDYVYRVLDILERPCYINGITPCCLIDRRLLEYNATLNATDTVGCTPLHMAAR